jgi:TM2 domain-containing membrane protein YozV
MNCALHTDATAVAYCRTCGKALCEACKREVQGTVFCEPCLAARINVGAGGNFGAGPGYIPARGPEDASPGLALFLGFIPGVGAFYNGQFLKGFVHVIVFSTLIWMSDHGMGGFAGILIMAWFFYMVFDAYTTARARRYGLPIPDPIGLNAILEGRDGTFRQRVEQAGERLGTHVEYAAKNIGQQWQKAGGGMPGGTAANVAPGGVTGQGASQGGPPSGEAPNVDQNAASSAASTTAQNANQNATENANQGSAAYVGPHGTYYSGPEGTYYGPPMERERSPVGAVVLIGCGILLLLANLGWFSFHWVSHLWPVILITIGLWLFIKRQRGAR